MLKNLIFTFLLSLPASIKIDPIKLIKNAFP